MNDRRVPLAQQIDELQSRAVEELDALDRYYTDTKLAWQFMRWLQKGGHGLDARSRDTGEVTHLADLAARSTVYVERLPEVCLQQLISIFESYFLDLLRIWLTANPKGLKAKTVRFSDILRASDLEAVTAIVVDEELSQVSYKAVKGWFERLEESVNLNCPEDKEIAQLAEAKATRDVLVHNRGIANKIYIQKAGGLARYALGEQIDVPEPYFRDTWALLSKMVRDLSQGAIQKAAASTSSDPL